ncbi:hypothetical protein [Exiguobacterium aurantiacum]|uniref:SMODS and SLOG-associating 2TM effector domain-containing protein n=1 Tax=Exiguobacterium aurantiacum TaxID=33987 RepID=A0ABY5FL15_9BACL|nr:hypothetical protein [Exiguobacterium aurantiacum]UTT42268.1 hypothetical protein NMQ00_11975 [Exiguobacterium aurantiacum]
MTEEEKKAKIKKLENEIVELNFKKFKLQMGHPLLNSLQSSLEIRKKVSPLKKMNRIMIFLPILILLLPILVYQLSPNPDWNFSEVFAPYAIFIAVFMPIYQNFALKVNQENEHEKTEKFLEAILYQLYTKDTNIDVFKDARYLINGIDTKLSYDEKIEIMVNEIEQEIKNTEFEISKLKE